MKTSSNQINKDYFIGLDIGTSSVGWAAVDSEFHVLQKRRKSLWGTRLFDEGQPAAERRVFRTQRRRLARRRERISLLQSLFALVIGEKDQGFFQRLKDSFFYQDDKAIDQPNTLFNDEDYDDKSFHREYKTIYHLRYALMSAEKSMDVRLLYLALHHIIKKRGHFLMKGETLSEVKNFSECWQSFVSCVDGLDEKSDQSEKVASCFSLSHVDENQVADALGGEMKLSDKRKALEKLVIDKSWDKDEKNRAKQIVALICGSPVEMKKIFELEEDNEEAAKLKISFKNDDYDEKASGWMSALGDSFPLIERAKAVYDWSVLSRILHESESISEAKIKSYEQHKADLLCLKRLMTSLGKKHLMFNSPVSPKAKSKATDGEKKSTKAVNYSNYVGYYKKGGEKISCARCGYDDFIKGVRKHLPDLKKESDQLSAEQLADTQYINDRIEQGDFLPLQSQKDNAVIPYQVHLEELRKILDRAEKHHAFLGEKDAYGTVREKIEKLMTFRIPFYVGPLNDVHQKQGDEGFCWVVRHDKGSKEKITPWNFDEIVDRHASAERFMQRLSSKCTYIPTEDVLPKCSLIYQRFMVLNEINNLSIHGARITPELKQLIYTELFERKKKVTPKQITSFLNKQGYIKEGEESAVAGIDEEIKASLSSFITLRSIFGDRMPAEETLEEAILLITKLGMDAEMLHDRMKQLFPELAPALLKRLCALEASGWGALSRTFLCDLQMDGQGSIMKSLWATQANLMQLLGAEHGYGKLVNEYNDGCTATMQGGYQQVANLFLPPAVKRGVWQSLKIVKELVSIIGHAPKKICIEVARGPEEKKRTVSRRLRLKAQFEKYRDIEWAKEIEARTDGEFKSDRLYLYYSQRGRCMYTGEVIELEKLSVDYDVDHIQPISKTADDSLDNRVLVLKKENGRKSDNYPIDEPIRTKNAQSWKDLYNKGLISKRKLDHLLRNQPLTDEELAGFINRQLVETRQSTKAVAKLLEKLYPESRVIYVKAGHISRFRQLNSFIKLRELNDYHHGKDAYLSCVVGHVYDERFTRNVLHFIQKRPKYNLKLEKIFSADIPVRSQLIWRGGDDGSITTVRAMMGKNDLFVTQMQHVETGAFYDQNIVSVREGLAPIKSSDKRLHDTTRYGGYDKSKGAYFFCVEHKKGNKRIKTLEFIPVYLLQMIQEDEAVLDDYCREILGLLDHRILVRKIPMKSMFRIDGVPMMMCGRTAGRIVYNHQLQLVLEADMECILKNILRMHNEVSKGDSQYTDVAYLIKKYGLSLEQCIKFYDLLTDKLQNSIYRKITPSPLEKALAYREKFSVLVKQKENEDEILDREKHDKEQLLIQQCSDIVSYLCFFQCNAVIGKIDGVGLSRIVFTKNITDKESVQLIHQSITGFYEEAINLLDL